MIDGMMIFVVAVGGTGLVCCVLAVQSKYRRRNHGSSPESFGSNTADIFGIGHGSHFGGGGGHHSASDHSGNQFLEIPVSPVAPLEEAMAAEAVTEEAAAAINDAPPLTRVSVLCRCHTGF